MDNRAFLKLMSSARDLLGSGGGLSTETPFTAAAVPVAPSPTPTAPPMPDLPARVEPEGPPPAPPIATGFRTAPLALTVAGDPPAPRAQPASRWRRLCAWVKGLWPLWPSWERRGLYQRLDLRRRRHAFRAWYPKSEWKRRQRAAQIAREIDRSSGRKREVWLRILHAYLLAGLGPPEAVPLVRGARIHALHRDRDALTPPGTPLPPPPVPMLGVRSRR